MQNLTNNVVNLKEPPSKISLTYNFPILLPETTIPLTFKGIFEDKEKHWGILSLRWYFAFAFLISSAPLSYMSTKSVKVLRHIVCIFDIILLFSFPHPFLRQRKPSSPWQCNQNPPPWSSPHSPFMHNAYYEMTTCYIFDKDFVHVDVTLSIHYVITKNISKDWSSQIVVFIAT